MSEVECVGCCAMLMATPCLLGGSSNLTRSESPIQRGFGGKVAPPIPKLGLPAGGSRSLHLRCPTHDRVPIEKHMRRHANIDNLDFGKGLRSVEFWRIV